MKTHPEIPQWLLDQEGLTKRQWKSLKRRQLRDLESAAKDFLGGVSYTPKEIIHFRSCESAIERIIVDIEILKKACSIKNWGR